MGLVVTFGVGTDTHYKSDYRVAMSLVSMVLLRKDVENPQLENDRKMEDGVGEG